MIDPVTNHKALAKHSEGAIDAVPNHLTHKRHEQRWATVSIKYVTVLRRGRGNVNTSMWLAATQLSAADVDVDRKDVLVQATSLIASIFDMHYKLFKITANRYLL